MMSVRERFENDIQSVQRDLKELCEQSINAFELAFKAFKERNVDIALEIIDMDTEINRLEEMINDRVILIIAKQQPVATDLRRLVVILKAASDMERVGDYAVNIAKETIRLGKAPIIASTETLEEMHQRTLLMLRQIVDAFMDDNMTKAKEIAELDDKIDELYGETVTGLFRISDVPQENLSQLTSLAFIARYIERCGDHVTNMAEHLFYLIKGQHYELNN